jgi:hypothetical protein
MSREHELNYALHQLGRVVSYILRRQTLEEFQYSLGHAIQLTLRAQDAVRAEHNLLEAVRVYRETNLQ